MKQLVLLCTAFMLLLNSCNTTQGNGNVTTENRNTDNFTGIDVSSSFDVEVRIGSPASVKVEADDNIIKYIVTKVSGNDLVIKVESGHSISNAHMKVLVTMPSLKEIDASASADVKVLGTVTASGELKFTATSSADIEAEVDAPEINVEANSSGTVTLKGKTRNIKADASSAGSIKTAELLSENADITVSSGASAHVYASIKLDADASSGGDIVYSGAAQVNKNVSSGGSVNKGD